MKLELLGQARQWIVDTGQWLWNHPEVTWSGAGLTALAALVFLLNKAWAALGRKDSAPPVGNSSTVTQKSIGDRNIIGGTGPVHVKETHYHYAAPEPAPVSAEATCSLPSKDDIFLHREDELAWLDKHLHPDRIAAVCGPGGMGKTALTARAVRRLPPDRFPDGIIFHTFYHQANTAQAVQTIARALQLSVDGDVQQEVAAALGSRQALLILDGAEEADDLPAVLRLRGRCGVLITTRKKNDCGPLRLDLQPLPDDQSEEVLRAWGGEAGDQEAVEQIAGLLGGWPVALRLAGHYLHSRGEPAADYLRWLQKEPFRELGESEEHQAGNAALLLRRSTAQVGEDARLVLGLAGTLAYNLLAIAPMTALLEGDEGRCRKAVNELVNYGLLERRDDRLLERRGDRLHIGHALIHEYAARNLSLSTEALARVAAYYIAWCEEQTAAGVPGYALLDDERAHCLRLIAACLDGELWQEVKGLGNAMWEYLDRQGWWTEQLTAVEMGLDAARHSGGGRAEAWCLSVLGYTCTKRGELDKALEWHEQSLLIDRERGDRKNEGVTLNNMAEIYRQQGKYEQALEYYKQDLSICREGGDREGEGTTLNNIGMLYRAQDKYDEALSYYEQCLPIRKEVGDTIGEGATLNNIASIYRAKGEPDKAVEYYKKALAIRRELGDRAGEAESCWNLGLTYKDMGDLAKAEEYMALAVEIEEKIGHPDLENDREGLEQVRAGRQGA